jgi:cyclopropane fatty-acyl-phospholipid synthase-like methyltransferase
MEKNPDQITFETWNKVASLYQEKFMDLDIYNNSYDFFCDQLKINPSILEIGCGPGNITKYLLSKRPDFKITGTDFAPNMVELAKANNPSATFEVMDSRNISQLNLKFNAIVCGFCIPYLSHHDTLKLIADCYNLLLEDGILYLSFIEGDYNKSGFQSASTGDQVFFYYHSLEHLQDAFEKNRFKILKLENVKYETANRPEELHRIVIMQKQLL